MSITLPLDASLSPTRPLLKRRRSLIDHPAPRTGFGPHHYHKTTKKSTLFFGLALARPPLAVPQITLHQLWSRLDIDSQRLFAPLLAILKVGRAHRTSEASTSPPSVESSRSRSTSATSRLRVYISRTWRESTPTLLTFASRPHPTSSGTVPQRGISSCGSLNSSVISAAGAQPLCTCYLRARPTRHRARVTRWQALAMAAHRTRRQAPSLVVETPILLNDKQIVGLL